MISLALAIQKFSPHNTSQHTIRFKHPCKQYANSKHIFLNTLFIYIFPDFLHPLKECYETKSLIGLLSTVAVVVGMWACGDSSSTEPDDTASSSSSSEEKSISSESSTKDEKSESSSSIEISSSSTESSSSSETANSSDKTESSSSSEVSSSSDEAESSSSSELSSSSSEEIIDCSGKTGLDTLSATLVKVEEVVKSLMDEILTFKNTISRGLKVLDEKLKNLSWNSLDWKDVFFLYDTCWFPVELTKEICLEKNISIDEEWFKKELENIINVKILMK